MKFSITIPTYKATFFQECLESVLNQTYDDYEVVILNDCSPDGIKDIVVNCGKLKNGDKIRYYENEKNVGAVDVVDNWNKLLELAKGDYLLCMGDDDKLAPNCLEEYNHLMDKYPGLDVYHARTMMIDENSIFCDLQEERSEWQSVYSLIWHYTFKEGIQFVGDFLYKINPLRMNGGFYKLPLAWGADCITSFIAASSKGIANISTPVFYYRRNAHSITNCKNVRLKMAATKKYSEWMNGFLLNKPVDRMDKRYWQLINEGFDGKIKHHEIYMIGNDVSINYCVGVLYWLRNYKRYGLSFSQFLMGIGVGLAMKIR